MTQAKENNVVEADFTEVQGEAAAAQAEQEVVVSAALTISAMSNGQLQLSVSEDHEQLSPLQIEAIVKQVYEQLHEQRIVSNTLELLKAKLG